MSNKEYLLHIFGFDKAGNPEAIKKADFTPEALSRFEWFWLHVSYSSNQVKPLLKALEVPEQLRSALCAKESRPRLFTHQDYLFLSIRSIAETKQGNRGEVMTPVRMAISKQWVVTSQREGTATVNQLAKDLKEGVACKGPGEMVSDLIFAVIGHTSEVLDEMDTKIDAVEHSIAKDPRLTFRSDIMWLRSRLIQIRRYLIPQREALSRLTIVDIEWFTTQDHNAYRSALDLAIKIIEDIDEAKDRLMVAHESLIVMSQELINRRIYLISMVSVVFLPLTFVTGLLGINVGGIPGANSSHAFAMISGGLLLIGLVLLVYFRTRKWI